MASTLVQARGAFFFVSDSWSLSCKHRAGPAHLGMILDMVASYVPSDAACTCAVTCADEMNSHICALRVYTICIRSEQGLVNYHLGPGDTTHGGELALFSFSYCLLLIEVSYGPCEFS